MRILLQSAYEEQQENLVVDELVELRQTAFYPVGLLRVKLNTGWCKILR